MDGGKWADVGIRPYGGDRDGTQAVPYVVGLRDTGQRGGSVSWVVRTGNRPLSSVLLTFFCLFEVLCEIKIPYRYFTAMR